MAWDFTTLNNFSFINNNITPNVNNKLKKYDEIIYSEKISEMLIDST